MAVYERNRKLILPFLTPALFLYLLFFIYPTIRAFYYSAFEWTGFTSELKFEGLANFVELMNDRWFWKSLLNTAIILSVGGLFIFGLSFLFTATLSSGIKGKKFFRAVIFLPNVIAPVALTVLWGFIYNFRFGLINGFLRTVGLRSLAKPWMGPDYIFGAMVVMIVWTYVGFYLVILLSGVAKIPPELYEVGKIEGANALQMFFKVTLPLIWEIFTIAVVYWGIFALKMFEIVYSFSGFLPKAEMWTSAVYVYILGFGKINPIYRLGYATAVAVVLLIFVMIFVVTSRFLMERKRVEY